jgi:formylglycine-generating enzyme required for sulfatase activity
MGWKNVNLRSDMTRLRRRAGVSGWPRLFHSMRASRQTELQREFPIHVVCSWLGNSPRIAQQSYLLVTEDDFARAAGAKKVMVEEFLEKEWRNLKDFEWCGLKHYNSASFSRFKPRHLSRSKKHMTRPVSIFLSSLFILGMIQLGCQTYAQSPKTITNSIGMKLVLIPKGTFMMGSPIEEEGADNDEEQHQVTIGKDYYLGVTEVTQGQYEKVMGTNPSYFQKRVIRKSDSSMYPVELVSWEDAVEFCKKLSDLPEEKKAGRVYRLPTEAEWEYACRAGSKAAYSFGANSKTLGDYAWFGENSGRQTHPVGEKKANAWGLYDMHGNVWEWCSDWYGVYPKGSVSDPSGPSEGSCRVVRGGFWFGVAAGCRSADRSRFDPSVLSLGFRVALSSSGIPR